MLFALLSRFLHWGHGLATRSHLENVDGICYKELTGTWHHLEGWDVLYNIIFLLFSKNIAI